MSNLRTRTLVAVVAIPLILLLTMAGGYYFFGFIALVSGIALYEFYSLAKTRGASPQVWTGIVFGLCINAIFLFARLRSAVLSALAAQGVAVPFPSMTQTLLIALLTIIPCMLLIELFRNKGQAIMNISTTAFGVVYVSLFLGSLIGLRELFIPEDFPVYRFFDVRGFAVPEDVAATVYRWGGFTVIAVFATIWICDTAAYFAGRTLGRHKLFVRVSPNKTWEGAVAGFVAAIGTFLLARWIALPYLSAAQAFICGLIIGVFGQLGDLAESLLKRDAGVKDSSTLIPGHGGALDRFDSLMFVSPLLFLYLDFVVF